MCSLGFGPGNAMSTTVVGATMLAALIEVGVDAMRPNKPKKHANGKANATGQLVTEDTSRDLVTSNAATHI